MKDTLLKRYISKAIKRNSESDKLEFKDARGGFPKNIWRAITAFSNSPHGGYILFGIEEDRQKNTIKIVGVNNMAYLQERTADFIINKIKHIGQHNLYPFEYDNKQLLYLKISETQKEKKPCYYNELGLPRGACIRIGNTNRVITDEELRAFLRYSPSYKYDLELISNTTLEMLNEQKIKHFLEESAKRTNRKLLTKFPQYKVLNNLGIVQKRNDKLIPTVGGFLIFSMKKPQSLHAFSRLIIRCIRYAGNNSASDIIDKQDVDGTLDEQIEQVIKFILRNIARKASIEGTKRKEYFEYPKEALREIVVNAIIHRDYQLTGTYTQVNIFSDRIEISNPGTLPPGITIDNLRDAQFSRNEIIARIMADMNYMEEYGRGIDIVYFHMLRRDLVEPLFKNKANAFKVTLLGERYKDLNTRQIKFWYLLQDRGKLTALDAHSYFEDVSRATINSDLKQMVDKQMISRKGSSNNTHYISNY